MTESQRKALNKKLLIYLHLYFNGDDKKVFDELLNHRIQEKITTTVVNRYFKDNHLSPRDFITYLDRSFPEDLTNKVLNGDVNVLVIDRKKQKVC